jgi:hypothetical protein
MEVSHGASSQKVPIILLAERLHFHWEQMNSYIKVPYPQKKSELIIKLEDISKEKGGNRHARTIRKNARRT